MRIKKHLEEILMINNRNMYRSIYIILIIKIKQFFTT